MPAKEFKGAATKTALNTAMTAGSPTDAGTFTVTGTVSGYPTGGANGNFVLVIGRGTASEEKILCSARASSTFTVATGGRGYDGTAAGSHAIGDDVEHVLDAATVADHDDHIYDTVRDDHTQYLDTTRHAAVVHTSAMLGTDSVGADEIAAGAVGTTELASAAVTVAKAAGALLDDLAVFAIEGAVAVQTGKLRFRLPYAVAVQAVSLAIGTAPAGASLIVDVHKNGTTIFTTQANRPSIAAGSNATAADATPDVTAVAAGDYLTVDVDQVGSTTAGSDLTVFIRYRKT